MLFDFSPRRRGSVRTDPTRLPVQFPAGKVPSLPRYALAVSSRIHVLNLQEVCFSFSISKIDLPLSRPLILYAVVENLLRLSYAVVAHVSYRAQRPVVIRAAAGYFQLLYAFLALVRVDLFMSTSAYFTRSPYIALSI